MGEEMKALTLIIMLVTLAAANAAPKKKWMVKKAEPAEKTAKEDVSTTHKFSGMKLKGDLKKPELGYRFGEDGMREEGLVEIPENFDQEIIDEARNL